MSIKKISLTILLLLGISIISYMVGVYFPLVKEPAIVLSPEKKTVSAFEYLSLIINAILAVLTFFTIIVALLKDEIVGLWKKVIFEARLENDHGFVENISRKSTTASADNYELKIKITNCGTINAFDCRVIISKVIHINTQSGNRRDIKLSNWKIPISIDNQIFSPSTSFEFAVAEINLKKENSIKDPTGPIRPEPQHEPLLFIAGNQINKDYHSGQIEIHFSVHCNSTANLKKIIVIQWDGQWEERLADIQPGRLKASFKNIKNKVDA